MSKSVVIPPTLIRQKAFGIETHNLVGRNIEFKTGKQKKQFFVHSVECDLETGSGNLDLVFLTKKALKEFQYGEAPSSKEAQHATLVTFSAAPDSKNFLIYQNQTVPFEVLSLSTVPNVLRSQSALLASYPIGETLKVPSAMENPVALPNTFNEIIIVGQSLTNRVRPEGVNAAEHAANSNNFTTVLYAADAHQPTYKSIRPLTTGIMAAYNIFPVRSVDGQSLKAGKLDS